MDARLIELLNGSGKQSYILPFFWQHGEDEATLREYMGKINDCGIYEVCVECRPHPDFCGPKWWADMDVILDEARRRDMRVWLLDDAHFPTGYAGGAFADADPALCKQYIDFSSADVAGPAPSVELNLSELMQPGFSMAGASASMFARGAKIRRFDDDSLLCVTACRIGEGDVIEESVDLGGFVSGDRIIWDVPVGWWRVFVVRRTRNGGGRTDYMNVLDAASVRVLIDSVYEPQYAHYSADFGRAFAGFFSDEPLFGNTFGFDFNERIGHRNMPLPWSAELESMLSARLGADTDTLLPLLWKDGDAALTAKVRYAYMDAATRLVSENFSGQLGRWCEKHGVEYIGHVVEDNGQHARLGSSLGHYFRALDGQHMAGIDDIGGQFMFAGENHHRNGFTGGDGEFYHFELAKLGSSHAHIDPKKRGRAMCEIFGAYGWGFGVRDMKFVADHFLVSGINRFTPHAFSPKAFPDPDCPPHFYAHGENPQFRHFGALMGYMQRCCHLLDGGEHIAPAALLYHAEAEWAGEYMPDKRPARILLENQIDFDIVPSDLFADGGAALRGGLLHINGESYRALVIPYSQFITPAVADFAKAASDAAFPVLFVGGKPDGLCSGVRREICGETVSAEELASRLRALGAFDVLAEAPFRHLRYIRCRRGDDLFMFTNEDPAAAFDGWVELPVSGSVRAYDPWQNRLLPLESEPSERGCRIRLHIPVYGSLFVVFGDGYAEPEAEREFSGHVLTPDKWAVSMSPSVSYPDFSPAYESGPALESFALRYPDFSGIIAYDSIFDAEGRTSAALEIDNAYEGAEVWLNEKRVGLRVVPPFLFDLTDALKPGINSLHIEISTTLERKTHGMRNDSMMLRGSSALMPTGIVGGVRIKFR